ncbi:MAG TPA: DUF1552 domain-containing protein [Polyangia bacterium]|jgi:hypothetical protein|nr:DUF1552 domain-containing protein [Polyangia bacterium]
MNRRSPIDSRTKFSRRRLLRGMGATAMALTSPVWKTATAFGADASAPAAKRFIGIFSANGTIPKAFFPSDTATDAPLTLSPILMPLKTYQSKMLVLKGVHMSSTNLPNQPGGPHMKGPGGMLTGGSLGPGSFTGAGGPAGWADSISVDQAIVNKIGSTTKFPSWEFGARVTGQEPLTVISYRGKDMPNRIHGDPWEVYTTMFADANLSSDQLTKVLNERKSIIDFLKDDITRLQTRIAKSDKVRLDAHLTGIASLEQQLTNSAGSCKPPTQPATKLDPNAMANYPTIAQMQLDLMALAQTCGLTKVSTFMFANADSWQLYPFIGVPDEHHATSHLADNDAVAVDKLTKINVWHAQQIAYLFDKLAAVPDTGGGTVLDNTLVLWGNELGVGNSHTYQNIPWMLAGGGGYFKTGRYLQFQNQNHNNLLVSIMHAMGFEDVTTFGYPQLCTGPLTGLTV